MRREESDDSVQPVLAGVDTDEGWQTVLAAAACAEALDRGNEARTFALAGGPELKQVPVGHPDAAITWRPTSGWQQLLPSSDPPHALIDLYLPVCSATTARPITVGHLGQSLDGFIATHAGESQFVTGRANILHLHRMRALSDAIVVGAGTVAADDPQLTTRHVSGPNPLRVVLDPSRRLGDHYRVFTDDEAETLYVCGRSLARPGETHFGRARVLPAFDPSGALDVEELLRLLHARGCSRTFIEGGGVTVSMFLEAKGLDRLHIAIAALIIGNGRPAIRLAPPTSLGECQRPSYRVFRMGGDVLFDCDLRAEAPGEGDTGNGGGGSGEPPVTRII